MVTESQNIRPRRIVDEMRTSYLDYAMSVIVSRALPDVRDGLKPVQRRILYAMDDLGLRANTSHKKCARIIGEVLGKYHPHGDSPVYEAMVRMAQDFTLRYPLVDGQGNFGSIDNDPPAAMRYTEARLSPQAEELLTDLDKQTVDFKANFDDSLNEPVVLPARLPNLLINGAAGIAVGMATNIPPHHLGEIAEGVKMLLDNPDAGVDDLMTVVQGPELPSGAIVFAGQDRVWLRDLYATGRGRFVMRAVQHVEETARGNRMQIVYTELPYQLNKAALVEQIANLVRDKRLDGIADLRDESDRHGLRVVVELKRDGNVQMTLAQLFKMTPLQTSFNANMVALVEGRPVRISLKQGIQAHIDHRREIIRRRTEFDLQKAQDRHHIVEGLLKAIDEIDRIINAIREAESADAAKQALQQPPFLLSERQAQAVLDMQLRRLAALERGKLEEEFQELTETIEYLEGLLADSKKIDNLIRDDVTEVTELYAGDRRTAIVAQDVADFNAEDLIAHQACAISVSAEGYVKRVPLETYRAQHRGGKGVKGMTTREEDLVTHLLVVDTHDFLLLFTDRGRVFSLKAHEVEERSREARGLPLRNLIQIDPGENVTAIVPASEFTQDFILLATRQGQIKKTPLEEFATVRRAGLIAFNISDGDALVRAAYAHEGDDVIVMTDAGLAVRFQVNSLRSASRGSGGVRAIQVPDAVALIGVEAVKENHEFLTITTRGYGKRTKVTEYPQKGRGGKGMIAHKVTDKTGPVVALHQVSGEEEVVLIAEGGKFLRTRVNQIAEVGRSTQGVKVMSTDDDRVAAVAVVDMSRSFGEKPGLNEAGLNDADSSESGEANGVDASTAEATPADPAEEAAVDPAAKNGRTPRPRNGKSSS
jgi:DNA gyrase subunit A